MTRDKIDQKLTMETSNNELVDMSKSFMKKVKSGC